MRTPDRAREVIDEVAAHRRRRSAWWSRSASCCRARCSTRVPLGFVNVHFSLLPRWRGAAPVERAILAGDAETGVCIMELEEGLDTGPVYARRGDADRSRRDRRRAARPGSSNRDPAPRRRRSRSLSDLDPIPQAGEPTYADKLDGRGVRLDLTRPGRGARPRRPRRQPAPGRVDRARRAAAQGPAARRPEDDGDGEPGRSAHGARSPPEPACSSSIEVQPEGKAPMTGATRGWRAVRGAAHAVRHVRERTAASRSTRSFASKTAPTRTWCSRRCCAPPTRAARPRVRHRPRLRHRARQRRLDDLLIPRCHQPLDRLDPPVRAALRLGAYQLLHDVPAHAAVDATVSAARSPAPVGCVNAVLRAVAAARSAVPRAGDVAVALLVSRLDRRRARATTVPRDELEPLLAIGNEPAAVTLRPNPRRTTADALAAELEGRRVRGRRAARSSPTRSSCAAG